MPLTVDLRAMTHNLPPATHHVRQLKNSGAEAIEVVSALDCGGDTVSLFKPKCAPDAARVKLCVARLLDKPDPLFVSPDDDLGRMAVDSP